MSDFCYVNNKKVLVIDVEATLELILKTYILKIKETEDGVFDHSCCATKIHEIHTVFLSGVTPELMKISVEQLLHLLRYFAELELVDRFRLIRLTNLINRVIIARTI